MINKTIDKTIKELLEKKNILEKEIAEQSVKIKDLELEEKKKKEIERKRIFEEENLKKQLDQIIKEEERIEKKTVELKKISLKPASFEERQKIIKEIEETENQKRSINTKKQNLEKGFEEIKNQLNKEEEKKEEESKLQKSFEEISNSITEEKKKLEIKTSEIKEIERAIIEEQKKEAVFGEPHSIEREEKKKKKKETKEKLKEVLIKIKSLEIWNKLAAVTSYQMVGIDISDNSIEVLQLGPQGKLLAYGRSILEEGIVQDGIILEQKKLIDALKETLKNTKPHSLAPELGAEIRAIISLPDSKTYIQYFVFKDQSNLYQKIQEKIKETVPIQFKDLYFDFWQIGNIKGEVKILCVAAKQELIGSYIYFLRVAGIIPVVLDIESSSIARALLSGTTGENTMILDIGARTTILGIHNKEGAMCLAVSMPYAGIYFTKKVAENFNLSFDEAEEKKVNQGFKENSEVLPILEKTGQKIINEAKEAIKFYETEFGEKLTKIILAGGSALLPEIDLFFQKHFTAKVEIGNPLSKIKTEEFDKRKGILYANVIGLALRGISSDPVKSGINLLPEEIKTKERKTQKEKQKSVLFGAVFFAVAGLLLLAASIFYLVYLPIPAEMIPLRHRILLIPEPIKEEITIVRIKEEFIDKKIPLFIKPDEETEIVVEITTQDVLEFLQEKENWLKVKVRGKEGWIKTEYVDIQSPIR